MRLLKWLLAGSVLVCKAASLRHTKTEGRSNDGKASLFKRNFGVAQIGCVGSDRVLVSQAHQEVVAILNYGKQRLERLVAMLESNPVPAYINMTPEDRTLWQTWEAFYGKVWSLSAPKQNEAAVNRVKTVQSLAATIYDNLIGLFAPNINIMCGETFLWQKSPDSTTNPGHLWDSHGEVTVPGSGYWLEFDQGSGYSSCSASPAMTAYTYPAIFNKPGINDESVIVLCPNPMNGWRNKEASFDFVTNYHNLVTIGAKTMRLDDVWAYLPCTLIHEYTHSVPLTKGRTNYMKNGETKPLIDVCVGGQQVYQWNCIHNLAKSSPDSAANNADTFALFLTAIYFNLNDWSTGFSEDLGLVVATPKP